MNVVVRCESLCRTYQEDAYPVKALDEVSFQVNDGEFVSLAGPSGSGKSTLLNLIGGLDRPTSGEVYLGETRLNDLDATHLSDLRLFELGFIFQDYNLIPVLNALENVEFTMQLQGVSAKERTDRALATLESLGLGDLAHRRPSELSGGQQQRVAIARAIVTRPRVLLADEPSANLDSKSTEGLLVLLQNLNREQGVTIITATHDPMVMRYARRRVQLVDGHIDADESAET